MGRNTIESILSFQNFDIMEDLGTTIYLGFFVSGTDETEENNCMILKIETENQTTSRKFALGINYEKKCTWANRGNYSYHYGLKNL